LLERAAGSLPLTDAEPTIRPLVYPVDWLFRPEPPPLSDFGRRFLAEGDSWFTIGTLNLAQASNVLFKLDVARTTAIVNCAYPGDTLQHITDSLRDPYFDKLLRAPRFALFWEAILISGGGNDLIDAAQVPPLDANGQPIAQDLRLLLTPAEAAASGAPDPDRFISDPGWNTLARYLKANFALLVQRRDQGPSARRPILLHTYAVPTVRPAGTVGAPSGWMFPAFERAGIAAADRQATSDRLFDRLRQLLLSLDMNSGSADALPDVHVFDSAGLPDIVAALPGSTGASNDWANEIHLSPAGYGKLGRAFGARIEQVLAGYP
jgi:hypothetical protein